MISAYLDTLTAALGFDRALARRVRREVEDHLREAVAADPAGDGAAAERRAIAEFGDPGIIAAQFAAPSLVKRTKRAGITVLLVLAAALAAMKIRIAWYAAMRWPVHEDVKAVSEIVGSIDRCAFWLAVIVGAAAWAAIAAHRVPVAVDPVFGRRHRRCSLLLALATGALVVSVISDGVLTALRLPAVALPAEFLVPVLSMAIEVAGAGVLVWQVRDAARRATLTEAMPGT